jgi:glycosyltransferase involved in cell wall biosynthesis
MGCTDVRVSVVIPVFNEFGHLLHSLQHFIAGISEFPDCLAEVIVVDDGSEPPIDEKHLQATIDTRIRVITQDNQGRYLARQAGILHSSGNYILMFDSRVKVDAGSFDFLVQRLIDGELDQLWVGPSKLGEGIPLIGHFWRGIEMIAWRRYYQSSRELTVASKDIDGYPIGTTLLGVSRERLMNALQENSHLAEIDGRFVSDDTKLIRDLLVDTDARYSLGFNCIYTPRFSLISFLKHAHHRGRVFVDGHLSKGSRYLLPWLVMAVMALVLPAVFLFWKGALFLALPGLLLGYVGMRFIVKLPHKETLSLIIYGPIFLYCYLSGSFVGLKYRFTKRTHLPMDGLR